MLYGEHVRLRAIERGDIPTFVRWFNDPEVRRYLLLFGPMSEAEEERWFEAQLDSKDQFLFCIDAPVEEDGGEEWVTVGNMALSHVDWRNRAAVMGIALGEKGFWNRGYGTDAVRTMLGFAFDELGLNRVELDVFEFNERAIRCYEKVGFRQEGTRRSALFKEGRFHDIHLMAVLREEFRGEGGR